MNFTRRRTLVAAGAAVGLAGCLDRPDSGAGETPTDTPDDGGPTDTPGDGTPTDQPTTDVFQLGPSTDRPWWTTNEGDTGFVTVLASDRDDPWMVEDVSAVDGLASWLGATDFDRSTIVYVETAAPNACYRDLTIEDVGVADGEIVGSATAADGRDTDEACATVETYPSAFVRVTTDGVPAEATFTVTDGWDETSEVSADGRYIDPAGLPGHVRPGGDPRKLESFTCDTEGFERHWAPTEDVSLGEASSDGDLTFAMRFHGTQTVKAGDAGAPQVGRGNEIRITLRNVSTDVQYTGNRYKYGLQVLTEDGWRDVRGTTEGTLGYTDEALQHRPGEGFEWAFEMTEDGVIEDGHPHADSLEVCPGLPAGRYRFVYFEADGDPLAVEFDYTD